VGKPVLIDFTGHACVNCRKMEANVWPGKQVLPLLRDQYVLIQLYIETIARRPGELVIPYSKYVLPNDLTVIATEYHSDPLVHVPLLDELARTYLVADRGYDADPLVAALAARGTQAVIPPRHKHRHPRAYDPARYAQRHPVERLFSRLRQFRRVATRYDKLDADFLAFIHLAATALWLRDY